MHRHPFTDPRDIKICLLYFLRVSLIATSPASSLFASVVIPCKTVLKFMHNQVHVNAFMHFV